MKTNSRFFQYFYTAFCKWQYHSKSGPFSHLAFNSDATLMGAYNPVHNGQAQTSASCCPGTCRINPVETFKDVWQVFRSDTCACITDHQPGVLLLSFHRDPYCSAIICVIDGVIH